MANSSARQRASVHEHWSSKGGFLLAAVGSAVGLGNVWRFPYIAGVGGGGAFVMIYLLAITVFIAPLLIAEISIGRRAGLSPIGALGSLGKAEGGGRHWGKLGGFGIIIALLGLSFYSAVAGWTLAYIIEALKGAFAGLDAAGSNALQERIAGDPLTSTIWHALFMGLTILIVARGIRGGLEKAVNWMMPALFAIILLLVAYAAWAGDFAAAWHFMFAVDFGKIDARVIHSAVGQAFFTLGIGVGSMMTYGAYLDKSVSIVRSVAIIAGADTLVAILAGLAVFPIVFQSGLTPASGPALVFVSLPIAFGQMPGGAFVGALFFILLAIAALTSGIALLEPAISWLEERTRHSRRRMALAVGVVVWLIGLASVFSFNIWAGWHPLSFIAMFAEANIFGILEHTVADILIPVSGILISLFAGWVLSRESALDEIGAGDGWLFKGWRFAVRYLTPATVAWVLWRGL